MSLKFAYIFIKLKELEFFLIDGVVLIVQFQVMGLYSYKGNPVFCLITRKRLYVFPTMKIDLANLYQKTVKRITMNIKTMTTDSRLGTGNNDCWLLTCHCHVIFLLSSIMKNYRSVTVDFISMLLGPSKRFFKVYLHLLKTFW